MANPNPSPSTRFQPGQSGNPGGRAKGVSLATMIAESLTEADARAIVQAAIRRAKRGDVRYFQALLDRIDGRAVQRVSGIEDGAPIVTTVTVRLETPEPDAPSLAGIEGIRARAGE